MTCKEIFIYKFYLRIIIIQVFFLNFDLIAFVYNNFLIKTDPFKAVPMTINGIKIKIFEYFLMKYDLLKFIIYI